MTTKKEYINMKLAPIVLFTYNRPWHTQQTIEALQKNELAKESELFIFSDGGKDKTSWGKVNEVREYLKTINGFKKVILTFQDKNIGLADSIISGVTKIVNQYGKIIVLEDDIVTSQYFLKFMNEALDFYEKENKVWHISGWNYPIRVITEKEVYFSSFGNTWGWATWKSRWLHFKKDTDYLLNTFDTNMINKFNIENIYNFWSQVILNKEGKINTWAIYWYATFFLNNGLCLNPINSLVKNIGFDGSGENCGVSDLYFINKIENLKIKDLYTDNMVDDYIVDKIKLYYYKNQQSSNNFIESLRILYKQLDLLKSTNEKFFVFGAGSGAKLIVNYMNKNILKIIVSEQNSLTNLLNIDIIHLNELTKNINHRIIISSFGYEDEIKKLFIMNNINSDKLIFLKY
jgi:hypothetical protein